MKRPMLAAIVALIASFGITLTPVPVSAATPNCGGTSLVAGVLTGQLMRVPTVGNATPNQFNCDLGPGSAAVPVMRLQIDLNDCMHDNLKVDGLYGPLTTAAVKSEQKAEGLPASEQDGLYGPITILGGATRGFLYQTQGLGCDQISEVVTSGSS